MRLATKLSLSYAALLLALILLVLGLAVIQLLRLAHSIQNLPYPASPVEARLIANHLGENGLTATIPAEWLAPTLGESGWFQALDQQGREVQAAGAPPDRLTQYTPAQLADLATRDQKRAWGYQLATIRTEANEPIGTVILAVASNKVMPVSIYLPAQFSERFSLYFGRGVLMAIGALLLLLLLASAWYARWVSRPLVRLSQELELVAAGERGRRIETSGRDEIAKLGQSFNALVERLSEAERERHRLEIARQDLVANLSHDLRTPLTALQGFAEELARPDTPPDLRQRNVAIIRRRVAELDSLLGDLLELSRLQSIPPGPQEVIDLAETLRERLIDLVPEIEQAGAELSAELPEEPVMLRADRKLIGRALQNLVQNAIRHGDPSQITVSLTQDDAGAIIRIADNGRGIPADQLAHLFDRYYRGSSATAKGRGSGLGLAIVREIAQHHGGTVQVESAPGEGTVFTLRLSGSCKVAIR